MPASLDLASVRAGIANVLETIPEIKRVNAYVTGVEGKGNLPFAELERGPILGPTVSIEGTGRGDEGLGQFSHTVYWTIRVYARMASRSDAAEKDDLYAGRLLDAFNADLLIDPNGPGVVDSSRLAEVTPFEHDSGPWWVTTASLVTKIISTR